MAFYTIAEAAIISQKSQKTIRRHIAAGEIEATKIQNKYRINQAAFDLWNGSTEYTKIVSIFDSIVPDKSSENKSDEIDISKEWDKDGWQNVNYRNGYNFIDLFSGAGGLSCGLTMAGFNPVSYVEIMPDAVETYKYNFNKQKKLVSEIDSQDICDEKVRNNLINSLNNTHIHLVAGGFPCQGFSMAGNRVVTDERNSLYLRMLDVVKRLKPEFVVMENVLGLRSMLGGKVEAKIIQDYKDIGYNVSIAVLNSADYKVAQLRKRVIFIGNRIGAKNYYPQPLLDEDHYITQGECIEKYMDMPENKSINHIFTKHTDKIIKKIQELPEGCSLYENYSDSWKKSHWDKPSCTIKENHGGVNLHPKKPRALTPRELAALQSFPDDFIFSGSKKSQLVQIGNAVPPLLGKAIGIAVMKSLDIANNTQRGK